MSDQDHQYWAWHQNTGPGGAILDARVLSRENAAKEGWVDNPAKLGFDHHGDGDMHAIESVKKAFGEGRLAPFESMVAPTINENKELREENVRLEQLVESLRAELSSRPSFDEKMQRAGDEYADEVRGSASSTAVPVRDHHGGGAAPLSADADPLAVPPPPDAGGEAEGED